ncbi:MAG: glucuronate isomerase [Firmicutes bacterium]|nr:glucuronate isomerase [Bacillota bacterium]
MRKFMDGDFLLTTETAKTLFHEHAENCPIIDYHNHLPAAEIFEKKTYENLAQVWLAADHYKWRCMRVCGIDEKYITGDASDYDKFMKFAGIMPKLIGTPVYHWAHLELQRYFGIDIPLKAETADEIWSKTCDMLTGEGFDAVSLLNKMDVKVLCTTDDPADDLEWHLAIKNADDIPFLVLPSFRPDRFLNIDQPTWRGALAQLADRYEKVSTWEELQTALCKSLDFFCEAGCKVTDHGFIHFRYARETADITAEAVFDKAISGGVLTEEEISVFQGALLKFLAAEYNKRDMAMQLHLGPIRNNSPKLMKAFGADAGGDSIGAATDPFMLGAFLGDLEETDDLPKTILYNLNPADSVMLATMAVNYGSKVQYGAAWWLHDHIRGINEQLDQLLETGMFAGSVGMLTDSRSFTSFGRHEYFRRILCEKIGNLVESGQYPADMEVLGEMVEDICWRNAVRYFGFDI